MSLLIITLLFWKHKATIYFPHRFLSRIWTRNGESGLYLLYNLCPGVEKFSRLVPSNIWMWFGDLSCSYCVLFVGLYLDWFHLSHREITDVGEEIFFSIPYIFEVWKLNWRKADEQEGKLNLVVCVYIEVHKEYDCRKELGFRIYAIAILMEKRMFREKFLKQMNFRSKGVKAFRKKWSNSLDAWIGL